METMKAVVLDEWGGDLDVRTVDQPIPEPGEVRVSVRACGVTRTIENAIQGGLSDDEMLLPRIPGHEFAGVVDEVGDRVSELSVDDRVLSYFYLTCGQCDACRRGDTNQCTDFGGWFGVNRDGAYAEQAVVPASNLLPLPDEATFEQGAIATDGLATPLHIANRVGIDDTDTVLVIGAAGRVGIHLAQLATLRGAHVLAADVDSNRLDLIDETTNDAVVPINAESEDFVAEIRAATPYGDGPTVVVDMVGHVPTLRDAWSAMTMGARFVTLTTHHERILDVPLREFVVKEATLMGSRYATKDEVVRAARLLADGRVDSVITDTVDLDSVPAVHRRIRAGKTHGMTVVRPQS